MQVRKLKESSEFNKLAYIYPPALQKSLIHRQANRIFRKIDTDKEKIDSCECCGRYVGQEPTVGSLFYDTLKELSYLGPGVPLLFVFTKNVIIFAWILLAIVGIIGLILNALSNICHDDNCKHQNVFGQIFLSDDVQNFELVVAMVIVFTLMWVILNQYFVYRCRVTENKADEDIITPSDFAIFLFDLPDNTSKHDVQEMIQRKKRAIKARLKLDNLSDQTRKIYKQIQDLKIQMIIFPCDISELLEEQKKQEEQFIEYVKEGKQSQFHRQYTKRPHQMTNVAIVVFEKEKSKSVFLEDKGFCYHVHNFFCSWYSEPNSLIIKNTKIAVTRAAEPDDIIWENLEWSFKSVLLTKFVTNAFALLLLLMGGLIQYWLAVWQVKNLEPSASTFAILIFSSSLVIFLNFLISQVLFWTTKKEGNITTSRLNASLNLKISIFQFCNTGLFYMLAHFIAFHLTQNNVRDQMQQIFATKITSFMIIDAFSESAFILVTGYFQIPNSLFRILAKYNFIYCSQKKYNKIHELNDSKITDKYAHLLKTLWLTAFYTPFAPVVPIISIIGLTIYYFTLKIAFRRFYKITSLRSVETNDRAMRLSYFAPFMLNLGLLLIFLYYQGPKFQVEFSIKITIYTFLGLSAIYGFVPWFHVNQAAAPMSTKSNVSYQDVKHRFQMTYDHKQLNMFSDRHLIKQNNENYFLMNQIKRLSEQRNRNSAALPTDKNIRTLTSLGNEDLFTGRMLNSDPILGFNPLQ